MPVSARRPFLLMSLSGLAAWSVPVASLAGPRLAPRADSPLVGVDPVIVQSGLTARWQSAMHRDLGWAAHWSEMDSGAVLAQLEQGQIPAGVFLSHPKADVLDKQGLIYQRHALAKTDVLLLGPADDIAGIHGELDAARALSQVLAAAAAGAANWQAPEPGSALAAVADKLSKGVASQGLRARAPTSNASAKKSPAYRLMTRAQWLKHPPQGERLKIWSKDDPRLVLQAEVACSFRARHEGAKLFVSWLQWPLAQSAVKSAAPAWQRI